MAKCKPSASGSQKKGRRNPSLTPERIAEMLAKQRQDKRLLEQKKKAIAAKKAYKAHKSDRGKIVMVGTDGGKNPQNKGRKGYLVYVTKRGKKWLLATWKKPPYGPKKVKDLEPAYRGLKKATENFLRVRRVMVSRGAVVKAKGKLTPAKVGPWDFSDKMVRKLAKGIKEGIESQASHRTFIINVIVLIRVPDGTTESIAFDVPIDKPDHISIELGGMANFISQKFYAFMAQQLAFAGYVTSGSANHIRKLEHNDGEDEEDWMDSRGQPWKGQGLDVVRILRIDWELQQAR